MEEKIIKSENESGLNRPVWNEELKTELAKQVGKIVFDWSEGEEDTDDLDECIEIAGSILEYHSNDNGYELAKEFEENGFNPNAELVELLDCVFSMKEEIKSKAVKEWVAKNNLMLKYNIGEFVKANISRLGELNCEIVQLYPYSLQYGLWHESMGYAKGKGHRIIDEENIIELIF